MLGLGSPISTQHVQVRINGDVAFLRGVMKVVLEPGEGQPEERFEW